MRRRALNAKAELQRAFLARVVGQHDALPRLPGLQLAPELVCVGVRDHLACRKWGGARLRATLATYAGPYAGPYAKTCAGP
eukprot:6920999-Alexandrium_andersonii.AAC.1